MRFSGTHYEYSSSAAGSSSGLPLSGNYLVVSESKATERKRAEAKGKRDIREAEQHAAAVAAVAVNRGRASLSGSVPPPPRPLPTAAPVIAPVGNAKRQSKRVSSHDRKVRTGDVRPGYCSAICEDPDCKFHVVFSWSKVLNCCVCTKSVAHCTTCTSRANDDREERVGTHPFRKSELAPTILHLVATSKKVTPTLTLILTLALALTLTLTLAARLFAQAALYNPNPDP